MELFLDTIFSFPTVVFTFFMCMAVLFWCVAAVGLMDIDFLDVGHADVSCDVCTDIHVDHGDIGSNFGVEAGHESDIGWFAGLLMKLGLDSVPLTIVLTVLFFCGWVISYFIQLLALSYVPLGLLRVPVGLVVCFIVLFPAAYATGFICRPLRSFFKKLDEDHFASSALGIVGQAAVIRSGSVSSTFGEADYDDKGAGMILRVRADEVLGLKKGDRVVMIEYNAADSSYWVVPEDEFTGL